MLGGVLKKNQQRTKPPLYARMPPLPTDQKKKKKRIAPQLLGAVGSGAGVESVAPNAAFAAGTGDVKNKKQKTGSSTGYLRVKRAADDRQGRDAPGAGEFSRRTAVSRSTTRKARKRRKSGMRTIGMAVT